MRRRLRPALLLFSLLLVLSFAWTACRPDPYAIFLRTLTPGEPIELPGHRVLTIEGVDGRTLEGVHLEGPAETCKGTLVLDAPEARIEPVSSADGGEDGPGRRIRIVLEEPRALERCGRSQSVTTHRRLTITVDLDRGAGDR